MKARKSSKQSSYRCRDVRTQRFPTIGTQGLAHKRSHSVLPLPDIPSTFCLRGVKANLSHTNTAVKLKRRLNTGPLPGRNNNRHLLVISQVVRRKCRSTLACLFLELLQFLPLSKSTESPRVKGWNRTDRPLVCPWKRALSEGRWGRQVCIYRMRFQEETGKFPTFKYWSDSRTGKFIVRYRAWSVCKYTLAI